APWSCSRAGGQVVDMRHWSFGCAMTAGALTTIADAAVASAPLAVTRNLRRSVIQVSFSASHELMVGALGDVIPRADQPLELHERRVHLPGHRRLLRLFLDDLGRQRASAADRRAAARTPFC